MDSQIRESSNIPVINLAVAPGASGRLKQPPLKVFAWRFVEIFLVTNRFQISSRLRVKTLRFFGAKIGKNVIFRPGTRVKSPWELVIGDRCWIGEGVWFENRDRITIGDDVVISQDSYLVTGAHAYRTDMALNGRPITVESGAWISSRCVVLGGAHVGTSAVISPMVVVKGNVPENSILSAPEPVVVGKRFLDVNER